MSQSATMKFLTADNSGDAEVSTKRPEIEDVKDNDEQTFFSLEIVNGDIQVRKAIVVEADGEDEEDELDWELL